MSEKDTTIPKEKYTTNINVSGVPISTKEKADAVADKKGITTSALVKNILNDFLDKQPK